MSFLKQYFTNFRLFMMIGDVLAGIISIYMVLLYSLEELTLEGVSLGTLCAFTLALIFTSFFVELYKHERLGDKKKLSLRIIVNIVLSIILISVLYDIMPQFGLKKKLLFISIPLFGIFQLLWRLIYDPIHNFPGITKKILILGTGPSARMIGKLTNERYYNYKLIGFVSSPIESSTVPESMIVDNWSNLSKVINRTEPNTIVVALPENKNILPFNDVLASKLTGIEVLDMQTFFEKLTGKLLVEQIKPSWFIFSSGFKITILKKFYKQISDWILSITGLILCIPIFPLIALMIILDSGGPIFYGQTRVGKGGRLFTVYKFRTMVKDAEKKSGAQWAREDDDRITLVGKFLRKSRLDELPQLFNVLKGDLSIVGPRPERPEFYEELKSLIPLFSERLAVKPGITGWAQINYGYGATIEDSYEKLRYDLYYIKHFSPSLDIFIILETVNVILFGRGAR